MKKTRNKATKPFDIVAVRFADRPGQLYHYKIKAGVATPGMAFMVENHKGSSIVFVVQLNLTTEKELMEEMCLSEIKWIRYKVVPL